MRFIFNVFEYYGVTDISALTSQPLVIIGAGRSGTNMLRDVLTKLDGVHTWPCDEINYIWRHGNRQCSTDEFTAEMATSYVRGFVRNRFNAVCASRASSKCLSEESRFLVEKTCANSLRVEFVDRILPEAKYLFLVRDGRDVVTSASKRWKAPLDLPYLIAKAKYVPTSDVPYYGSRYFLNRVAKLRSKSNSLSTWGPRIQGMQTLAANNDSEYICAAQWSRCVERSAQAFSGMSGEKVLKLHYEDFVKNPIDSLERITDFMGRSTERTELKSACIDVRRGSGKKNNKEFVPFRNDLFDLMESTLKQQGYI